MSDAQEPAPINPGINPVEPGPAGPPVQGPLTYPGIPVPDNRVGKDLQEPTAPTSTKPWDRLTSMLRSTPPAPEPFPRPTIVPSPTPDLQPAAPVVAQTPEPIAPVPQETTPQAPTTSPENPVIQDETIKELIAAAGEGAEPVQLTSDQQALALVGAKEAFAGTNFPTFRGAVSIGSRVFGVWEPRGGQSGDILIEIKSEDQKTTPPQPQV